MTLVLTRRCLLTSLTILTIGLSTSFSEARTQSRPVLEADKVWAFTVDRKTKKWVFKSIKTMDQAAVEKVFRRNLRGYPRSKASVLAKKLFSLARKYKFDPAFILSVIHTESTFNNAAKSPVGARGLMQIMPRTASYIAKRWRIKYRGLKDLTDPCKNMEMGVVYLAYLRERFNHFDQFLAAYNAGPSIVARLVKRNRFAPRITKPYIEKIRRRVGPMSRIRVAQLVAPTITRVSLGPEVSIRPKKSKYSSKKRLRGRTPSKLGNKRISVSALKKIRNGV